MAITDMKRMDVMDVPDKNWYVVHVRARHEFKVLCLLTNAGIDVFLATIERLRRWKDRNKLVSFPLFPGYLFVHIHRMPKEILFVSKLSGVVGFLGMVAGEPESVPEEQISSLKRLAEFKIKADPYPYLKEGQRVRIKRGPLAGVEGILDKKTGQHVLVLSVDILQRGISVKVDSSDVESV
ncbi:MAG: UpxY family transcription antiterminator [Nitrospirae bacterium]|nr:UpxY family transcription antiterminator [Nitrospirota bacterium]